MKLSDVLKETSLKDLAAQSIEVGNVYLIPMDEANGVTPHNGDTFRNKYFIVLGWNENEIYGGVITNSNINQHVPVAIRMYHMPIKCNKYHFLTHDSFVNCSCLKEVNLEKFSSWKFVGTVSQEDVDLIIGTIKESPLESPKHLQMFGL